MPFASDAQRRWFFAHLDDAEVRDAQPVPAEAVAHAHHLTQAQREAVKNYNVRGKDVNRDGTSDPDLDAAIESAPTIEATVYRGEPLSHSVRGYDLAMLDGKDRIEAIYQNVADKAEAMYPVGAEVEIGLNYTSTSFDPQPALDAALTKTSFGVIFEINANKGLYVGGVKGLTFDDESEFLIGRGAKFRVDHVIREGKVMNVMGDEKRRVIVKVTQL